MAVMFTTTTSSGFDFQISFDAGNSNDAQGYLNFQIWRAVRTPRYWRVMPRGRVAAALPPLPPPQARGGRKRKVEDDADLIDDTDRYKQKVKYEGMLEEFDLEGI